MTAHKWLDPAWHAPDGYQYARTHNTSEAFAARQRQRMAAAQPQQKPDNVKLIRKGKA